MNHIHFPDRWALLKLPDNNYKVFATWEGGYLNAFDWRINSGIKSVEQDKVYYYFEGYSGSIYKCKKKSYGIKSFEANLLLNKILNENKIELIDENELDQVLRLHFDRNTSG